MVEPKTSNRLLEALADSEDAEFIPIWLECSPFTMTSIERGLALYRATRYIVERRIPGVFVECGVCKGGSVMIAMRTLQLLGSATRRFILFDTFDGMTTPSPVDDDVRGRHASDLMQGSSGEQVATLSRARASLAEVQANIATTGYNPQKIRMVQGDVCASIPRTDVAPIGLLRLDTDFYDSTYVELTYLYPRLNHQGVLIVDDYGHWKGARKAVEDYFADAGPAPQPRAPRPFFHWIDYTGRIAVRSDPPDELPAELVKDPSTSWASPTRDGVAIAAPEERYDYEPPGLPNPGLLKYFPSLVASDPRRNRWPYLRLASPHIWRTDSRSRNQHIGVLSLEEAILLHHLALPYAGKRGLAIGCHFAWSTAHLLAAGLHLDVVDPKLSVREQFEAVDQSLRQIPTKGSYGLWAAFSPSIIPAIRQTKPNPWSFVFIDGDHDGEAPSLDAQAVLPHCAPDATVVLHDLTSPDVTKGLAVYRAAGWNVRLYNTMQVIGVATRGAVTPAEYPPDPRMPVIADAHLRPFA